MFLLTLVSFANYVDRMVLNAVAQPIKQEFALSDTQLGLLTGFAFVLLYALAALPLAALADRGSKSTVLALSVAFWSVATAVCGLTKSFSQLVTARLAVGIGESGCQPIGYALIADYFPGSRRATAIGWFMLGNSAGVAAGFALGGWLGQAYGWRMAFICVGLPGLLLASILAVYLRGAPRPRARASLGGPAPSLRHGVPLLLRNRNYRWALIANGVYSFMIFGPVAWLPSFFVRSHGLPLRVAGLWSGLTIGLGMAAGMLIGGLCADRLSRRSESAPQLFCMAAALATGVAYLVALSLPDATWAFGATFVASAVGALGAPSNATTVQNLCDPRLRAVAASLVTLTISLLGVGLAPLVIGMLSDALAPQFGVNALRTALALSLTVSWAAAALYYHLARLLRGHGISAALRAAG
jgi:predicted MFS family arabinose efflux permease